MNNIGLHFIWVVKMEHKLFTDEIIYQYEFTNRV